MSKARLETFSDGVIAILITIMVLELKPLETATWEALHVSGGSILIYALSFIYLGIYWTNHHHLFHAVTHINGRILWANLHLLFWLSLVPFATESMHHNGFLPIPTALYGVTLFLSAISWTIMQREILRVEGRSSQLAKLLGRDLKGKISAVLYAVAIPLALVNRWLADAIFVIVALMWLVPDRRIEAHLG